jgi:hypothetical protein
MIVRKMKRILLGKTKSSTTILVCLGLFAIVAIQSGLYFVHLRIDFSQLMRDRKALLFMSCQHFMRRHDYKVEEVSHLWDSVIYIPKLNFMWCPVHQASSNRWYENTLKLQVSTTKRAFVALEQDLGFFKKKIEFLERFCFSNFSKNGPRKIRKKNYLIFDTISLQFG